MKRWNYYEFLTSLIMTLPRLGGLGSEKDGTEEVRGENEVIIEGDED